MTIFVRDKQSALSLSYPISMTLTQLKEMDTLKHYRKYLRKIEDIHSNSSGYKQETN